MIPISLALSAFIPLALVFQVFEDGSTYRGRLKILGRIIVKAYYKNLLEPNITECHNSDQVTKLVQENVNKVLEDSSFLRAAEADENVSDHSHHDS